MDASQFFVRAGGPVEKPRNPSAHFAGAARKAGTRGLLLFGYFLLRQEKVTRPSAGGRNARRAGEQPGVNAQKRNRGHWTPVYAEVTATKRAASNDTKRHPADKQSSTLTTRSVTTSPCCSFHSPLTAPPAAFTG
jgi:hypothetical protein